MANFKVTLNDISMRKLCANRPVGRSPEDFARQLLEDALKPLPDSKPPAADKPPTVHFAEGGRYVKRDSSGTVRTLGGGWAWCGCDNPHRERAPKEVRLTKEVGEVTCGVCLGMMKRWVKIGDLR